MRAVVKVWLVLLFLLPGLAAADAFPGQQTFAGQSLVLNGKGVRTKFFIKLYEAGLYLPTKSADANAILTTSTPMAMRLSILSSLITSEKMEEAVREGFQKSTGGTISPQLQGNIDRLITVFKQPIKQGDLYDFVYTSGNTLIIKNGRQTSSIPGAEFKRAFFGIWLGTPPAQDSLKKALLGS